MATLPGFGTKDPSSFNWFHVAKFRERSIIYVQFGSSGLSSFLSAQTDSSADMDPQQPKFFDPQEREREKQASREADERAFAAGESGESIDARNAFLTADRTIVHWDPSRPF